MSVSIRTFACLGTGLGTVVFTTVGTVPEQFWIYQTGGSGSERNGTVDICIKERF